MMFTAAEELLDRTRLAALQQRVKEADTAIPEIREPDGEAACVPTPLTANLYCSTSTPHAHLQLCYMRLPLPTSSTGSLPMLTCAPHFTIPVADAVAAATKRRAAPGEHRPAEGDAASSAMVEEEEEQQSSGRAPEYPLPADTYYLAHLFAEFVGQCTRARRSAPTLPQELVALSRGQWDDVLGSQTCAAMDVTSVMRAFRQAPKHCTYMHVAAQEATSAKIDEPEGFLPLKVKEGVGSRVLRAMAREILLAIGDVRAEIVMDMSASFGCGTDEAEQIVSRLVTEEFHDLAISV